jgi:hypothetical protein
MVKGPIFQMVSLARAETNRLQVLDGLVPRFGPLFLRKRHELLASIAHFLHLDPCLLTDNLDLEQGWDRHHGFQSTLAKEPVYHQCPLQCHSRRVVSLPWPDFHAVK